MVTRYLNRFFSKVDSFLRTQIGSSVPDKYHPVLKNIYHTGLQLYCYGRGRQCPICGWKGRKYLSYGIQVTRKEIRCPSCNSHPRHRAIWMYLQQETKIFKNEVNLLYVAPKKEMYTKLQSYSNIDSVSGDLKMKHVDTHFDLQNIPFKKSSFDIAICVSVFAQVPDDIQAMEELYRVLKPNGWLLTRNTIDYDHDGTVELNSGSQTRRINYGGKYHTRTFPDHYQRVYGRDFSDRLESGGFIVDVESFVQSLTDIEREQYGLHYNDEIYIGNK